MSQSEHGLLCRNVSDTVGVHGAVYLFNNKIYGIFNSNLNSVKDKVIK